MTNADSTPIFVIGAGLARSGTKSLKDALELLYQKPCYHMFEVQDRHPDHVNVWFKLFDLLEQNPDAQLPEDMIKQLFSGYCATTDFPSCTIYKQLMRFYPEAKVVLTVRDPRQWIQSVRETIRPKHSILGRYRWQRVTERLLFMPRYSLLTDRSMKICLGQNIDLNDDEQMIEAFTRRIEEVKRAVPAEKLLLFEVKEGWQPLCRFLGKPIPEATFPRTNDRQQLQKRLNRLTRQALFKINPVIIVILLAGIVGICLSAIV